MLRDYQIDLVARVRAAWADGAANVMATAPTGAGKTVIMGHILREECAPAVVMAHRQELVSQIALALNREHVPHSIIAPRELTRQIVAAQMATHGYSDYSSRSQIKVASVHSLAKKDGTIDLWFRQVKLAIIDEGHHVIKGGIWSQALGLFPHARGLLLTAHALRGDSLGLGRHADGVVDRLIIGPSGRCLIDRGMLVDYRFCIPQTDLKLDQIQVGPSGEFNMREVAKAVHSSSRIVGDVVSTYKRFASGKLGITFAVDIDAAKKLAQAYRVAGVSAEIITADTPLNVRTGLMKQFRARQITQLVSVDVLGEGVDVPGVEVVSLARPTNSFQVYAQQIGRALRLVIEDEYAANNWGSFSDAQRLQYIAASPKPRALIIDHVQNMIRHGLPDVPKLYTLDRKDKKARGASVTLYRACTNCFQPFEKYLLSCPYCQTPWEPAGRGSPDQVEGDLVLLDERILEAMRKEVSRIDGPARIPESAPATATRSIIKNHADRQTAQRILRHQIALYGSAAEHDGLSDREGHKRFYLDFGVDVLSAQALNSADSEALAAKIRAYLSERNLQEYPR